MVKQIYDEEEYSRIEKEYENRAYYIQLPNDDIKKWIENGYFAHLRKELQVFHDMYFACKRFPGGCLYAFFFKNEISRDKFQTMLDELFKGKKVRFVNCEPNTTIEEIGLLAGSMSACPLFG